MYKRLEPKDVRIINLCFISVLCILVLIVSVYRTRNVKRKLSERDTSEETAANEVNHTLSESQVCVHQFIYGSLPCSYQYQHIQDEE